MSLSTFGTIPTTSKRAKITFTSQSGNGTSSINTGGTITVEIDCLWTDKDTHTPAQFSAYPSYPNFLLVNAQQEQCPLGMCKITLTYQASYSATPATSYCEQNGTFEAPITEHPHFDDWADDEQFDANGQFIGFNQSSDKAGVESYIVGTRIVVKKEYFTSKPTDESANIGKTQNPGLDYSGDGNWLVIGSQRSLEGLFWSRSSTYRWSAVAWNPDIYPAA